MAVQIQVGSFAPRVGAGSQSITGIGFQPTGVIFFGPTEAGISQNLRWMVGGIDGSNQFARYTYCPAGDNTSTYGFGNSTAKCIYLRDASPSTILDAAYTSLDADGFTVNWAVTNNNYVVSYIAFGGDVTVHVGSFTTGTSTGNQAITGVGFQPTSVIFAPYWWEEIGFGDGSNNFAWGGAQFPFSAAASRQTTTYSLMATQIAGPVLEADIDSLDADGFTINKATASNNITVFYIALGGCLAKTGTLTQPTSNGSQLVSGLGLQPVGLIFGSFGKASSAGMQNDTTCELGAFATNDKTVSIIAQNGANPSNTFTSRANSSILSRRASDGAQLSGAVVSALGADDFTLNWTVTDATARQIGYLALGEAPPPSAVRPHNLMTLGIGT